MEHSGRYREAIAEIGALGFNVSQMQRIKLSPIHSNQSPKQENPEKNSVHHSF